MAKWQPFRTVPRDESVWGLMRCRLTGIKSMNIIQVYDCRSYTRIRIGDTSKAEVMWAYDFLAWQPLPELPTEEELEGLV